MAVLEKKKEELEAKRWLFKRRKNWKKKKKHFCPQCGVLIQCYRSLTLKKQYFCFKCGVPNN